MFFNELKVTVFYIWIIVVGPKDIRPVGPPRNTNAYADKQVQTLLTSVLKPILNHGKILTLILFIPFVSLQHY